VILLDTNVISELMRPQPEPRVLAWADGLDPEAVAITAMNEAEILHGLARLPDGRRKQQLQQSWDALAAELFAGRIWPFTSEAAHWYAELLWQRERLAQPMATADAVAIDDVSSPASGSVTPKQQRVSPLMSGASMRCFCAAVPKTATGWGPKIFTCTAETPAMPAPDEAMRCIIAAASVTPRPLPPNQDYPQSYVPKVATEKLVSPIPPPPKLLSP
jgi:predicted nucleic acid-binding protein